MEKNDNNFEIVIENKTLLLQSCNKVWLLGSQTTLCFSWDADDALLYSEMKSCAGTNAEI